MRSPCCSSITTVLWPLCGWVELQKANPALAKIQANRMMQHWRRETSEQQRSSLSIPRFQKNPTFWWILNMSVSPIFVHSRQPPTLLQYKIQKQALLARVVVKRIEIEGDTGHQLDTGKIPTGDTERHTDNCDTRPCQILISPLGPTMPCLPVKDTNWSKQFCSHSHKYGRCNIMTWFYKTKNSEWLLLHEIYAKILALPRWGLTKKKGE